MFPTAPYTGANPHSFIIGGLFGGTNNDYYLGSGTDTTITVAGTTASVNAGVLSVLRPVGYRGQFQFQVRAYNKFGESNPSQFIFIYQDPVLVSSLAGSGAQQGAALSGYAIQTNGGNAPYSCATSPATGSLPTGVSINADCTLSGTPTQSGTFDFTLDVTDSSVGPGVGVASAPNPFTQRSGTLSLVVAVPLPTVTAVSPAFDNIAGGKSITITGTGFVDVTGVLFGGVAASSFVVDTPTQITATVPAAASAGTVAITVSTLFGTSADTAADDFEYGTAPVRLSGDTVSTFTIYTAANPFELTPQTIATVFSGAIEGIYIGSGTDTAQTIGGVTVAATPQGGATITRPTGYFGVIQSGLRAFNKFGVSEVKAWLIAGNAPLLVSSVAGAGAQQGTALSGYSIQTNGGNAPYSCFTSPATGTLPAGVSINADCTLTGTPTQSGTFEFRVYVTDSSVGPGAGAASAPNPFTQTSLTLSLVVAAPLPTVTAVSPNFDNIAGGKAITITGTNFTGATKVSFGTTDVPAANFTVNPAGTQIVLNAPAVASAGTVNVTVTTAGGASADTAADDFTYAAAPVVDGPSPAAGPLAGGTPVTIFGQNLTGATAVSFGGVPATGFTVNPAGTQITVNSPAGLAPGPVTISITTPGGTSADNGTSDDFTYLGVPVISSISPATGPTTGGTIVTINGSHLYNFGVGDDSKVMFGTTEASVAFRNETQMRVEAPAGAAGVVDISVTTGGGTSANTAADDFTYVAPTVTIDDVSMAEGDSGDTEFTFTARLNVAAGAIGPVLGFSFEVLPGTATIGDDILLQSSGGQFSPGATERKIRIFVSGDTNFEPDETFIVKLYNGQNVTFADDEGLGTILNDDAALAPTITAAFSPASIPADGTTEAELQLTIANPNAVQLTGVAVASATLPANLAGVGAGATSSCGGLAAYDGVNRTFAFSGGTLPGNGSCIVKLPVVTTVAGVYNYTTGAVSSTETGAGLTAATATGLTAVATPASVAVVSGSGQTATISTGFANPLVAIVRDFANNPMQGVTVDFAGPNAGASAVLGASSAATDANGQASVTATANATAGTYDIVATVTGVATGANFTLFNDRAAQTITFTAPPAQTFAPGGTVGLTATGGASGNPVTFASTTTSVCTTGGTNGATVTFVAAGACSVTASQAGNDNYLAATDVARSFDIGKASQTVLFTAPPAQTFAPGGTVGLTATGGASGNPVTFASTTTSVCTTGGTNGATVTFVAAGNCSVTASQAGNANYLAATDVARSFDIGKASQTVLFTAPPAQTFAPGGTVGLTATGGASGNPVTFASTTTSVCTTGETNGATVTFVSAGTCSVTASQAGNDNYLAATDAARSFDIGKASQTVLFTAPPAQTFAPGGTVGLTATGGGSNNPVTFASNSAAVCTVAGSTVTFVGAGNCSVTASQAGNANYEDATPVTDSFDIGKASQTVLFTAPPAQTFAPGGTVGLTATGGASGNPVTFASNSAAVCTVAGSTVMFTVAGSCSITASQAGNNNYEAAADVTAAFLIVDGTAPVFAGVPANIIVTTDPGKSTANVTFTAPTANDDLDGAVAPLQTAGLPSGADFPVGVTTNAYSATDAAGNSSNASFTVTVTDGEAPVLAVPADITVAANGVATIAVDYAAVTAADAVDGALTPVLVAGLASGAQFPLGETTVTYSATDSAGNTSTASFKVTVNDAARPSVLVSGAPGSVTANEAFTVTVAFGEPVTGFDAADVTVANGSVTGVAAGAAANSFAVTITATGGGDVSVSIPENAAFDVASNGNTASNMVTVTSTVVEETIEAIAESTTDRMHLLVSNQPDLLTNVFNPFGIGGGDLGYMAIDGDPNGMTFAFATSLGHFDRAIAKGLAGTMAAPQAGPQAGPLDAAASVQERILGRDVKGERQAAFGRGSALEAAPGQDLGEATEIAGPQRNYDLWVNVQGARSSATGAGGTELESSYWIGSFGGHWFVTRDLAIGALAQFDLFEQQNGSTGAAFDGSGWMAGPYAAGRVSGTNLSWSARASWGGSDNDISPLGTYTDNFSTSRFYAQGLIAGSYDFARWTATPKLQVDWYEERQEGYRDTLGNAIPEQQFSVGELTFGPSFSRSFATDGVTVTPSFGVTGVWTFAKEHGAVSTASPAEGDLRARLDASLAIAATDGWQLYFGGYLDGLFLDDYQSAGGTVTLKKAF